MTLIEALVLNFNIKTILLIVISFAIIYKVIRFYTQVLSLPPGPIPLPIVGNILTFRGTTEHSTLTINGLSKKYGPVITLWLGPKPFVYIFDLEIAKQVFHRVECCGRPESFLGNVLVSDNSHDMVFADYSESLHALRNIGISAVRTLSKSKEFAKTEFEIVDKTVEKLLGAFGNRPFGPEEQFYPMILQIAFMAAFGKTNINIDQDEDFIKMKEVFHGTLHSVVPRMALWEFLPISRYFDQAKLNYAKNQFKGALDITRKYCSKHYSEFNANNTKDICSLYIASRNEGIKEGKSWAKLVSEEHITRSVLDLFLAGLETKFQSFHWLLLLMTYYPEIQQKLRQEIETEIVDRIPEYEDRHRCHYVMAFISEAIRFRNVNPMAFYHRTLADVKIENYDIPKGTGLFVAQSSILMDEKHWTDAHEFKPERFLSDGEFVRNKSKAFIPFGIGRRVCVGEKLAVTDLFFMLVRLLQKTSDYTIELSTHSGLEPDSKHFFEFTPKYFEIYFKKIQK